MKNDSENLSQTSQEEEILEKSRQMIEESKAKNEQLAEQVCSIIFLYKSNEKSFLKKAKVFQRTLQRNEIYSAFNRYSHRPPIYPTVLKGTRSASNRFQQLK